MKWLNWILYSSMDARTDARGGPLTLEEIARREVLHTAVAWPTAAAVIGLALSAFKRDGISGLWRRSGFILGGAAAGFTTLNVLRYWKISSLALKHRVSFETMYEALIVHGIDLSVDLVRSATGSAFEDVVEFCREERLAAVRY
jgi:hypothetical protein